jgi:hypothetical protein
MRESDLTEERLRRCVSDEVFRRGEAYHEHGPVSGSGDHDVLRRSRSSSLPCRYGDRRALVDIESLSLLSGALPPRVRGFVTEWAATHQEELRRNWSWHARSSRFALSRRWSEPC